MAEEAAFVAQEFVSSLDNLPFEVAHILNEIKVKEKRVQELTERLSQRSQGVLKHIRSSTLGTAPANPKEAQTLSKIASEFDKVQALQHEKIVLAERLSLLVEKHTRRLASDVLQRVADLGGVEKPVVPPLVLTAPTSVRKVERAGGGAGGGGAEGLGAMAAVGTPGHHQPNVMAMPPPASTERGDNKKRRLNALHPQTGTPTSQSPIPFFGNYPGGGGVPGSNGFPPQSGTPGGINGPAGPGAGAAGYATPTPASAQQGAAASAAAGGAAAARGSTKRRRADEEEEEEEDEDEDAEGEPEDLEADGGADDDTLYCLCRQKSFGEMVGCDNEKCSIEWFHIKCVDLQVPLPERWFCPACVALGAGRTNKRDRKSGGGRK